MASFDHIFYADGRVEDISPDDGQYLSREKIKEVVGDNYKVIPMHEDQVALIYNETGKEEGLPFNHQATSIFLSAFYRQRIEIHGTAITCAYGELDVITIIDNIEYHD